MYIFTLCFDLFIPQVNYLKKRLEHEEVKTRVEHNGKILNALRQKLGNVSTHCYTHLFLFLFSFLFSFFLSVFFPQLKMSSIN